MHLLGPSNLPDCGTADPRVRGDVAAELKRLDRAHGSRGGFQFKACSR